MNLQEQETLADVAYIAGWMRVKCADSREMINKLIIIAELFNRRYAKNVANGEWVEDDYLEMVDEFATEQFELHDLMPLQSDDLHTDHPKQYDAWNDGEAQYCARLIMEGGNKNVPREHVMAYLQLQLRSAQNANAHDAITALNALILVRQIMDRL